jgi:hypothetical protein
MSHALFLENLSTDPVEQSIARKVMRILNDDTLDRAQRRAAIQRAQNELLRHRRQRSLRAALQAQAARVKLPKGYEPRSVMVREGVVYVGAAGRDGFVWLEAGAAPHGAAANEPAMAVDTPSRMDPIA